MREIIAALVAIVLLSPAAGASEYIRVKTKVANVRASMNTDSEIVAKASQGQVFKVHAAVGSWFEIYLFGGEYRYINAATAESTREPPPLNHPEATLRKACHEIVAAQDRAVAEAEARFPSDYPRQIALEHLLYDRYELPVFERFAIAPAHASHLTTTCARNRWL